MSRSVSQIKTPFTLYVFRTEVCFSSARFLTESKVLAFHNAFRSEKLDLHPQFYSDWPVCIYIYNVISLTK